MTGAVVGTARGLTARQRRQVAQTRCPRCGARAATPARPAEPCGFLAGDATYHLERLEQAARTVAAVPLFAVPGGAL